VIFPIAGAYTTVTGLVLWKRLVYVPWPWRGSLLWTTLLNWVLTMGLLFTIRFLVLTRLVQPLQRRTDYDELTGVYRPEIFWQRAEVLTRTLTACGRPWAFGYLDVDDFKQVHDTAGHFTGDAVLRKFGSLLKVHVRQEDIIGRLGGEEFGWVLSGCTTEEAVIAANRLLAAFQATHCDGLAGTCAFSAGVAGWQENDPAPASVWDVARTADHALYQAKAQGKGRVAVG
jgi:diguanylate cyclase (GGDEF)-like protein